MPMVRYFPTARFPKAHFVNGYNHAANDAADWHPRADVLERENAYEVSVELPGVSRDAVNVSFENNLLKIDGEVARNEDENARYYRNERRSGKFSRSFRVPERGVDADGIEAKFENGVLTLSLPKAAEVLPKKIEIAG